jgi:2'-5' RNA ligase
VRRTALSVIVLEAEPVVADFRARFAAESVARRIPPHVTLLFPFAALTLVDEQLRARVRAHFAAVQAFDAELNGVDRFDGHVWLAPAPRERFVELVTATCSRFPEFPPYGGDFDAPAPHLTVGASSADSTVDEIARAAEAELAPRLPVGFRADAAWLLVEQEDGTWAADERFPFAA